MNVLRFKFSLPALLILLFSFQIQSCKQKNNDGEIQTAIATKTQTDPSFAGVNATVKDGIVTLTGQCNDAPCKTNAEQAVKDIKGVKKVVNNITVAPVVVTADDPLKASVNQTLANYQGVQADVQDGVVTLRGEIKKDRLQQLMMDLNALKPKKIDNQLVIK
ncbi:BON domain-containing protein [Chitinophagaceae bacterium LB-8]|uniref:BON domain-containing protein n=1 Tax=Paraflavisolibacter caeni TaxID=2982496 RepID=A0A9X2XSM3_9BACT|nr:BON domain-containing protein [Paraflavisolibacter caeni]MCU7547705.1 BON domain-containing protein [Paraflavisolibacter caeni]